MQQENHEMQKKLIMAQQLIQAYKQQLDVLQLSAEIYQERTEMFKEILGYYVPHLQIGFEWKRVYLPVYGKIQSPPFSKN
jgi:SMC interacting uncharacterized protein involved in chromosome segregation